MTIPISSIHVNPERFRRDYGDLDDLCNQIETHGLIQPLVLAARSDGSHELLAGGRRLAALKRLGFTDLQHGVTCDPHRPGFVFRHEITSAVDAREIEFTENLARKDFDWKEKLRACCELHRLFCATYMGWSQDKTAGRLNISRPYVSHCLAFEPHLDDPIYAKCEGLADCIALRAQATIDNAVQELARRTLPQPTQDEEDADAADVDDISPDLPQRIKVPLSKMLIKADCLTYLADQPAESYDHIITDWPYGIKIGSRHKTTTGTSAAVRVAATHNREDNLALHEKIIPHLYRVLRSSGFFVTYLDIRTWQHTVDMLTAVGFRVQPYPFLMLKRYKPFNAAAELYFTCDYEIALVAAKGDARLTCPQDTSYVEVDAHDFTSNPFAKPYEAWAKLIEACTHRGQTILDPFAGEGSSLLAALRLSRSVVGIEIDDNHYAHMVENVSNFYRVLFTDSVDFV